MFPYGCYSTIIHGKVCNVYNKYNSFVEKFKLNFALKNIFLEFKFFINFIKLYFRSNCNLYLNRNAFKVDLIAVI